MAITRRGHRPGQAYRPTGHRASHSTLHSAWIHWTLNTASIVSLQYSVLSTPVHRTVRRTAVYVPIPLVQVRYRYEYGNIIRALAWRELLASGVALPSLFFLPHSPPDALKDISYIFCMLPSSIAHCDYSSYSFRAAIPVVAYAYGSAIFMLIQSLAMSRQHHTLE